ncbi:hypothetical protein CSHISOI_08375 [Colletotrichum shisoi]|uniref:Uncharacterized protein n=1 Tax=Colletotrichum shisoi TaxID=2078593 RepID=A0A5Q4BK40_9PEZI|nr:hypothetical protein CSHISOI_08375 [Colletotrichum shisoi]
MAARVAVTGRAPGWASWAGTVKMRFKRRSRSPKPRPLCRSTRISERAAVSWSSSRCDATN